jgi:hypothetical protein
MGNHAAKLFGQDEAEIEVEEYVQGIIAAINEAEREREACWGRFLSYKGDDYAW